MNVMHCAAMLEASIRQEIEATTGQAPGELQPFLAAVGKFQGEFELLLDRAQYTDIDTGRYPEVEAMTLLGNDGDWQEVLQQIGPLGEKALAALTTIWMIQALVEKSGQFYQQAALNSAHPSTRLFFRSLTEIKGMLRRRVDGLLRVLYNQVWSDIGFAPVLLGKD